MISGFGFSTIISQYYMVTLFQSNYQASFVGIIFQLSVTSINFWVTQLYVFYRRFMVARLLYQTIVVDDGLKQLKIKVSYRPYFVALLSTTCLMAITFFVDYGITTRQTKELIIVFFAFVLPFAFRSAVVFFISFQLVLFMHKLVLLNDHIEKLGEFDEDPEVTYRKDGSLYEKRTMIYNFMKCSDIYNDIMDGCKIIKECYSLLMLITITMNYIQTIFLIYGIMIGSEDFPLEGKVIILVMNYIVVICATVSAYLVENEVRLPEVTIFLLVLKHFVL